MLVVIVLSTGCTRVDYKINRTATGILVHASNPFKNSQDLEVITLRWERELRFNSNADFEKGLVNRLCEVYPVDLIPSDVLGVYSNKKVKFSYVIVSESSPPILRITKFEVFK